MLMDLPQQIKKKSQTELVSMLSDNLAAQFIPWCLIITLHKCQSHCALSFGDTQLSSHK